MRFKGGGIFSFPIGFPLKIKKINFEKKIENPRHYLHPPMHPQQDMNNVHMCVDGMKTGVMEKIACKGNLNPLLMWTSSQYMKFIMPRSSSVPTTN